MNVMNGTCLQRIKQPSYSRFRYRQVSLQFSLPSSRIQNDQIAKASSTDRFHSRQRHKWFWLHRKSSPHFSQLRSDSCGRTRLVGKVVLIFESVTNMHFKLCLLFQLINVTYNVTARRRDKKREKKFRRGIIILIFQKQQRQGNPQSCFTDPPLALYRLW